MQVPLISKTDYTPNGNKYTKTRLGSALCGTAFALGTNFKIEKYRKTADYANFLEQTAQRLKEQLKNFSPEILEKSIKQGQKLTKYGAIAAMAVAGILVGAVADFAINSKRRKSADKDSVSKA